MLCELEVTAFFKKNYSLLTKCISCVGKRRFVVPLFQMYGFQTMTVTDTDVKPGEMYQMLCLKVRCLIVLQSVTVTSEGQRLQYVTGKLDSAPANPE